MWSWEDSYYIITPSGRSFALSWAYIKQVVHSASFSLITCRRHQSEKSWWSVCRHYGQVSCCAALSHILNSRDPACNDLQVKKVKIGVAFSSLGRAGIPCTLSSLQWTRVRVLVWGPLLHVTSPLSQPVSCHVFSCSINKSQKAKKYI